MDYAAEWESLPAAKPPPAANDYAADWEKLPVSGAAVAEKAPGATPARARPFSKAAIRSQLDTGGSDLGAGVTSAVSGIGASIIGGWRGLATLATGGTLADAAAASQQEQAERTYQPETKGGQIAAEAIGLAGAPVTWAGRKLGELVQDSGAGGPAAATIAETLVNAAPLALGRGAGARPATMPQLPGANATVGQALRLPAKAGGEAMPVMQQPATVPLSEVGQPVADGPVQRQREPVAAPAGRAATQAGDTLKASPNALPALTDMKLPDLAAIPETAPVEGGLPAAVRPERQSLFARLGLKQARNSAIEGDTQKGAVDFQLSKFTEEPVGKAAADQFAAEKQALQQHAQGIINETGGTPGMGEGALIARGTSIVAPLDALKAYFRNATRALYKQADTAAGGLASVEPGGFAKIMNTESAFAGKAPNQSLGNGIRSYLREQGIMDKEGAIRPITVTEAEGIKQYINSQYSHETSGLAGIVKNALNKDVFKSAGEDVYAAGRDMYKLWQRTLGDPKGVSKIMDFDPMNPMNRAVPLEKIPDTVANLSNAQYNHLLKTLREAPAEIQPSAQAAIGEIQAHWGERLLRAGMGSTPDAMWNAPKVSAEIRLNAEKIGNAFKDSPELASKIADLQAGGNALRVPMSYPGAAAQAANAVKRGAMINILRPIGASIGGAAGSIFGPAGAGAGAFVGEKAGGGAATALAERSALKKWNKAVTQLKDIAP